MKAIPTTTHPVRDEMFVENIADYNEKGIEAIISTAREKHNSFLDEVLSNESPPLEGKTPVEKMNKLLNTKKGKGIYKNRKQTVEPVFGIIKEILGFRRFSLRGEEETNAEWSLVCTAYNLKRFFKMQVAA